MKMRSRYFISTICILLLISCNADAPSSTNANQKSTQETLKAPANALFQSIPSTESGVTFNNEIFETHQLNIITNSYMYNGGGVAVLDVNNDKLPDLYFASSMQRNKLYLNKGDMKFEDITQAAGVGADGGFKSGLTIVDINLDGWQDIYVCRTGLEANPERRNLLFINQQDGTFKEAGAEYGLNDISASNHANFFDYDLDGDLDMYLMNHPVDFKTVNNIAVEVVDGKQVRKSDPRTPYETDRFYENKGNGKFEDVTEKAGITNRAFGLSVSVHDFNTDGYPDVYVGNDYIEPDFLYLNNGNGTFTESNESFFRHMSNHTMGVDIADYNNDAKPDLVALDMIAEDNRRQKLLMTTMALARYNTLVKYEYGHQCMRNTLQLNLGDGKFSEIGTLAGISNTDWSWSVLLADYDNDGQKDMYITNGYRRDVTNLDYLTYTVDSLNRTGGITRERFPDFNQYLDLIPSEPLQNYMYKNNGDLTFDKVSTDWGFVQKSYSNGSAYADLDNDGDLDLVVNNIKSPAFIYKNTASEQNKGHYIQFEFEGPKPNPLGLGVEVLITTGSQQQYQQFTPTRGFFSSVHSILHFGTGAETTINRVEITWPDGKQQILENISADQRLLVKYSEAQGKSAQQDYSAQAVLRAKRPGGLNFKHQENDFEDFDRERLIPHRISREGPALAIADVNGDQLEDVFIGGAAGQIAGLFLQNSNGSFQSRVMQAFSNDKSYEDTDAVFFDADGDGDQDLFIVSGGSAAPMNNNTYQDRLYLNDGTGNFERAVNNVPRLLASGSSVAAYDYDKDGDKDLFIGGRVSPGAYPTTPESYILQNDNGTFSNVTETVSTNFGKVGMVSDLEWGDLNGDGQDELLVTGEWMPIKVFGINGGKLEDVTGNFGLNETQGWWNCVKAKDMDGDGDLDILAGNLGLNSRLRASKAAPLQLYAKDFDRNGSLDPIITYFNDGIEYPLARREMLILQIPEVKKKFVYFEPYSSASLADVFPSSQLEGAKKFKVVEFRSGYFENDGAGNFKFVAFPVEAQFAPINDILVKDCNGDGSPELLLVQNSYQSDVETGRYDAGSGVVLSRGEGNVWNVIPNIYAGFWAIQEARVIQPLNLGKGGDFVLIANNNSELEAFEVVK